VEHLDRHRGEGGLKLGGRGRAILHKHLQEVLADVITEDVRQTFSGRRKAARKVPMDVVVQYIASTFILVLNWWVETRSPLCSKEVDQIFGALITPWLAAISD
jgi:hypothetical protein